MNLQSIINSITLQPPMLKKVVPCCGAAAFGLYRLLFATGVDGRGLLKSGHFSWVLLCILSIAVGAVILASTAELPQGDSRFRRSVPAAVCCALAAVSVLLTGFGCLWNGQLIYVVGAMLAAAAFAAVMLCRFLGRRPNFLMHAVICVHFLLQLLKLYQENSFDPQIQDYLFQVLTCIALAFTAYQLAMADLNRGSRRWLWVSGMSAVYLCILTLGSSANGLSLTGAAWAFTTLMIPMRKREKAEN